MNEDKSVFTGVRDGSRQEAPQRMRQPQRWISGQEIYNGTYGGVKQEIVWKRLFYTKWFQPEGSAHAHKYSSPRAFNEAATTHQHEHP